MSAWGASEDSGRRSALWLAIILVGAWLLHPILTPVHVEGFSASIVSLALHLNDGELASYDRLHPANLEYFTLSRLGTVGFMSVLTGPLRLSGEWAIRVTTWLGFAALVASSYVLVRRWADASSAAAVIALLLIPGVSESSFFYNDTIFAAALGTTALAVLVGSTRLVATAVSGVLFGAAVVARLDAVLVAPAVMLVGYQQHGLGRAFWSRALVFTVAALVPIVAVPATLDATILDVVAITRYAIDLWGNAFRPAQHAREASFFLGIPAAVLAALGCLALTRQRDYGRLLLLAGVPLLFNLVAFGKIWQSRQLLPMTPFLAALTILGWRHVVTQSRASGGTPLKWTVLVVGAMAWIAPAALVRVSDGPRAPYGRLWTPALWRRWQVASAANHAEIRALVGRARAERTAIVTDSWDGDRYVHLALQETGYRSIAIEGAEEGCQKSTETFVRGHRLVLHVRLHQPFLPNWRQLAAERLGTLGMPCIERRRPERLVRLATLEQLRWSMTDAVTDDVRTAGERALAVIAESRYSPQLPVELRASDLEPLRRSYLRQAEQEETLTFGRPLATMALVEAERLMAPRVWASPPHSR